MVTVALVEPAPNWGWRHCGVALVDAGIDAELDTMMRNSCTGIGRCGDDEADGLGIDACGERRADALRTVRRRPTCRLDGADPKGLRASPSDVVPTAGRSADRRRVRPGFGLLGGPARGPRDDLVAEWSSGNVVNPSAGVQLPRGRDERLRPIRPSEWLFGSERANPASGPAVTAPARGRKLELSEASWSDRARRRARRRTMFVGTRLTGWPPSRRRPRSGCGTYYARNDGTRGAPRSAATR